VRPDDRRLVQKPAHRRAGLTERFPYRGGNWNNTSNAGVFSCNLNNPRSNTNTNIGFRPALGDSQKHGPYLGAVPVHHQKDPAILGQWPEHEQALAGQ